MFNPKPDHRTSKTLYSLQKSITNNIIAHSFFSFNIQTSPLIQLLLRNIKQTQLQSNPKTQSFHKFFISPRSKDTCRHAQKDKDRANSFHLLKEKKWKRETYWRMGTMPEGCLERSTGWLPSKPPCSAISSFLLFLTTPIIPKNTHRKSICLSGFLLFTPKSWIFYVDLSFHT